MPYLPLTHQPALLVVYQVQTSILYITIQRNLSTEFGIGTGEQIIRTGLARSLVESIYTAPDNAHEILQQILGQFCGAFIWSVTCVDRSQMPFHDSFVYAS